MRSPGLHCVVYLVTLAGFANRSTTPETAEAQSSVQKLSRGLGSHLSPGKNCQPGDSTQLLCKNRHWITPHLTNGCPALLKLPTQIELCFLIGVYSGYALGPALISPKQDKCRDLGLPAYILSHSSKWKCHRATAILQEMQSGGGTGRWGPSTCSHHTLQSHLDGTETTRLNCSHLAIKKRL